MNDALRVMVLPVMEGAPCACGSACALPDRTGNAEVRALAAGLVSGLGTSVEVVTADYSSADGRRTAARELTEAFAAAGMPEVQVTTANLGPILDAAGPFLLVGGGTILNRRLPPLDSLVEIVERLRSAAPAV